MSRSSHAFAAPSRAHNSYAPPRLMDCGCFCPVAFRRDAIAQRKANDKDPIRDLLNSLSDSSSDDEGGAPRKINGVLLMSKITRKQSHAKRKTKIAAAHAAVQASAAASAAASATASRAATPAAMGLGTHLPQVIAPAGEPDVPVVAEQRTKRGGLWHARKPVPKSSQKFRPKPLPALLRKGPASPRRKVTISRPGSRGSSRGGSRGASRRATAASGLSKAKTLLSQSAALLVERPAFRPGGGTNPGLLYV